MIENVSAKMFSLGVWRFKMIAGMYTGWARKQPSPYGIMLMPDQRSAHLFLGNYWLSVGFPKRGVDVETS